jgi:hypothetical protein
MLRRFPEVLLEDGLNLFTTCRAKGFEALGFNFLLRRLSGFQTNEWKLSVRAFNGWLQ